MNIVGVDIGGTKCAVSIWNRRTGLREHKVVATRSPGPTLDWILQAVHTAKPRWPFVIGVAAGGPLDAKRGIIQSPPNLPGWDDVRVTERLADEFGCSAYLMNDANANALAEWNFGAGRGSRSMVFLTAGTGMGAGIVLDGRLYEGATGNAGEVGHLRLAPRGPSGFGKAGSFEGFCSGGGIPELVRYLPRRKRPADLRRWMANHPSLREIARSAKAGEAVSCAVLAEAGRQLGRALAALVDVLNPDRIVIGSLYVRCRRFIEPTMREELAREALPESLAACRIVPAGLGAQVGNYGAICAALHARGGLEPQARALKSTAAARWRG